MEVKIVGSIQLDVYKRQAFGSPPLFECLDWAALDFI